MDAFSIPAIVNAENEHYHRTLREQKLCLQRCAACSYVRPPGRAICPECLAEDFSWQQMKGDAEVETFIWYFEDVLDRRFTQEWAYRDVPYNVALVRLAGGPALITNVDDVAFGELAAGLKVRPKFHPISGDYAILRFVPATSSPRSLPPPSLSLLR